MAHNYKIIISYDGTAYGGWQKQSNAPSIQEILQKQLSLLTREQVVLKGSGRTDAGVHAVGQVAHFHSSFPIDIYRFLHSLNAILPIDIRVHTMYEVPMAFHAQYSAIGKVYHYHLHTAPVLDPFKHLYSLHVYNKLDTELLKECASLFIGTHDFTSFANQPQLGSAGRNPVRTLKRLDVVEELNGIRFEFEADGFLYKMVRNITGTLLKVAAGQISLGDIPKIFEARDRARAGKAAPPHGLFLIRVDYPEHLQTFENDVHHGL